MTPGQTPGTSKGAPDLEEQASLAFARRRFGPWTAGDESELSARLAHDASYADAYRRVEQSWGAVGKQAASADLMAMREHALSRARRATARRWRSAGRQRTLWRLVAGLATVGVVLAAAYELAPFGWRPGEYRTGIGEQRAIELADHSRIALDAATRLRVHFSKDARVVQLISGQAQFWVAKDVARPFKVEADNHVVVAVGTVFIVEYVGQEMHVAMLEGKVAVLAQRSSDARSSDERTSTEEAPFMREDAKMKAPPGIAPRSMGGDIELTAGEGLHVRENGEATVIPRADLAAATAWREGKVIFHKEPLGEAVRQLNRYSSVQIEISDPALASMQVSGIFEEGDSLAFVEAVQSYLPVSADTASSGRIRLHLHPN